MEGKIKSFHWCLQEAWLNPKKHDPQSEDHIWALEEALRRAHPKYQRWHLVKNSPQEIECARGHKISTGDTYLRYTVPTGWGTEWIFCVGCAAMLFYFDDVTSLPVSQFNYWDYEKGEPGKTDKHNW